MSASHLTDHTAIAQWLKTYTVVTGTYTISPEGVVDVEGTLHLNTNIRSQPHEGSVFQGNELPVKFGTVTGTFACAHTTLTSLVNCPHTVEVFDCRNCQITNLEDGPQSVRIYKVASKVLNSLKGVPLNVRELHITSSALTNLKYLPSNLRLLELQNTRIQELIIDKPIDYIDIQCANVQKLELQHHITELVTLCHNLSTVKLQTFTQYECRNASALRQLTALGGPNASLKCLTLKSSGFPRCIDIAEAACVNLETYFDPVTLKGSWKNCFLGGTAHETGYQTGELNVKRAVFKSKTQSQYWRQFYRASKLEVSGTIGKPTADELRTMIQNKCDIQGTHKQNRVWFELLEMAAKPDTDWLEIERIFMKLYKEPLLAQVKPAEPEAVEIGLVL